MRDRYEDWTVAELIAALQTLPGNMRFTVRLPDETEIALAAEFPEGALLDRGDKGPDDREERAKAAKKGTT